MEPSSQKPQALARALRFFVASLFALFAPAIHAAPTASGGKGPMMLVFPGIVVLLIIVLILVTRRR